MSHMTGTHTPDTDAYRERLRHHRRMAMLDRLCARCGRDRPSRLATRRVRPPSRPAQDVEQLAGHEAHSGMLQREIGLAE